MFNFRFPIFCRDIQENFGQSLWSEAFLGKMNTIIGKKRLLAFQQGVFCAENIGERQKKSAPKTSNYHSSGVPKHPKTKVTSLESSFFCACASNVTLPNRNSAPKRGWKVYLPISHLVKLNFENSSAFYPLADFCLYLAYQSTLGNLIGLVGKLIKFGNQRGVICQF